MSRGVHFSSLRFVLNASENYASCQKMSLIRLLEVRNYLTGTDISHANKAGNFAQEFLD